MDLDFLLCVVVSDSLCISCYLCYCVDEVSGLCISFPVFHVCKGDLDRFVKGDVSFCIIGSCCCKFSCAVFYFEPELSCLLGSSGQVFGSVEPDGCAGVVAVLEDQGFGLVGQLCGYFSAFCIVGYFYFYCLYCAVIGYGFFCSWILLYFVSIGLLFQVSAVSIAQVVQIVFQVILECDLSDCVVGSCCYFISCFICNCECELSVFQAAAFQIFHSVQGYRIAVCVFVGDGDVLAVLIKGKGKFACCLIVSCFYFDCLRCCVVSQSASFCSCLLCQQICENLLCCITTICILHVCKGYSDCIIFESDVSICVVDCCHFLSSIFSCKCECELSVCQFPSCQFLGCVETDGCAGVVVVCKGNALCIIVKTQGQFSCCLVVRCMYCDALLGKVIIDCCIISFFFTYCISEILGNDIAVFFAALHLAEGDLKVLIKCDLSGCIIASF